MLRTRPAGRVRLVQSPQANQRQLRSSIEGLVHISNADVLKTSCPQQVQHPRPNISITYLIARTTIFQRFLRFLYERHLVLRGVCHIQHYTSARAGATNPACSRIWRNIKALSGISDLTGQQGLRTTSAVMIYCWEPAKWKVAVWGYFSAVISARTISSGKILKCVSPHHLSNGCGNKMITPLLAGWVAIVQALPAESGGGQCLKEGSEARFSIHIFKSS